MSSFGMRNILRLAHLHIGSVSSDVLYRPDAQIGNAEENLILQGWRHLAVAMTTSLLLACFDQSTAIQTNHSTNK